MSEENKLFLQIFFKENQSKVYNFDNIWSRLSKKLNNDQNQIMKNLQKFDSFEDANISEINLKSIYSEYKNIWKKHQTVKNCTSKQLRNIFFILFPNPNEGIPKGLHDDSNQFDDFLKNLIEKDKQSLLRRLFSELLYNYPSDNDLLFHRLNKTHKHLNKKSRGNQSLLKANSQFLFTEKKSPLLIAKNILNLKKDLSEVLREMWLKDRHLSSNGIGKHIIKELCNLVKKFLKEEDQDVLSRFLTYLSKDHDQVRFSADSYSAVTKTLLNPFEKKTPSKCIKTEVTKFLDQHIGDPRFKPEKWINMEKEKLIFLKWKIGETLEDFFELLSYTAKQNPDADRMWVYREEFIKSYWKEGCITDAWIVLGKEADKNRFKFLKKDFNHYGIIHTGNPAHSVLLFQIGDLIISEWNYNGKMRFWNKNNQFTPQMYNKQYSRKELVTKPNKEIIHSNAEKYYWQNKISRYIYRYTDISCPSDLQKNIDLYS